MSTNFKIHYQIQSFTQLVKSKMGKSNKKERKALKEANKKATEAKKVSKAEIRKEIAERNTELKGGLAFNHHW